MQTAIKKLYEDEAKAINEEIQKGILAISQKKSLSMCLSATKRPITAAEEHRTASLQMTFIISSRRRGFKVFFSRITLEDKLGTAYEPYIFAALNSAKGHGSARHKAREYFNAVWVKNEWSRYLSLVKNSNGKKDAHPRI